MKIMLHGRIAILSLALVLPACGGGRIDLSGPVDIPDLNPGQVGIGEVRPTSASPGQVVQIFGVNLGHPQTRVEIAGIPAQIQSRSMTSMVVIVPTIEPDVGYSLAVIVEESESFPGGFSIFEGFTVLP